MSFLSSISDFSSFWFLQARADVSRIEEMIERIYQEFPFDIIHAHVALPDGYAGMLAQKYQKPLVVTISMDKTYSKRFIVILSADVPNLFLTMLHRLHY